MAAYRAKLAIVSVTVIVTASYFSASAAFPEAKAPVASDWVAASETALVVEKGLSRRQAHLAVQVQGELLAANLPERLEAALASDFGGIWFDPEAATLHVAVASAANRRLPEEIAAQEGLGDRVDTTRVRSSWHELQATQETWNQRLVPLFARADVRTSIDPALNAVKVVFSESASPSERAEIERAASAASVNVLPIPAPRPHLRLTRDENVTTCNAFAKNEARCEKPITAGVSIEAENGEVCTAGPPALSAIQNDETFVMTAGHCLENGAGIGKRWYAYNRTGEKKEIGKSASLINGASADVGLIMLKTPGEWGLMGNRPAYASMAKWGLPGNPITSVSVAGQVAPVKGFSNCKEGQTSGQTCGTIKETEVTFEGTEHLVEDEGAKTEPGDSGGPWFATGEVIGLQLEGTTVGHIGENGIYEPLGTAFTMLDEKRDIEVKLLTTGNELRLAVPQFLAEAEETWPRGEQATQNVFAFNGGSVKCTTARFEGGPFARTEFSPVVLHPVYEGCTAFGLKAEITTTGCNYSLEATKEGGVTRIECESGKSIKITVVALSCNLTLGTQTPSTPKVGLTNAGSGSTADVLMKPEVSGITYTSSGGVCGSSGTNGTYTGTITLKDYANAAHTEQVALRWEKE